MIDAASAETVSVIMSAAYVGQELAAEFGHLPPAFLPIGTNRLYELQRLLFPETASIYLALPESFEPSWADKNRMAELRLQPLPLPDGLLLGEAIVFMINLISAAGKRVQILHGDTLIDTFPDHDGDWIGASESSEGYSWAEIDVVGDRVAVIETLDAGLPQESRRLIACGVFSFNGGILVRALTRARGDFIRGLGLYAAENFLGVSNIDSWHDFGHVQTYFRSRRIVTSARSFNNLQIDGRVARKTSEDSAKVMAEANWLASVPPTVRIFSIRLIDEGRDGPKGTFYETEYAYLPTLSELFVFGTLRRTVWMRILESCLEFLHVAVLHTDPNGCSGDGDNAIASLVVEKTQARLQQFADATGFGIDGMLHLDGRPYPSLMQIAADLAGCLDLHSGRRQSVMHGDFCFSNILYDSRVNRVRLIDPRGYVQTGQPSIFGDVRYDMAKLAHSVIGRYDQIIAGRYNMPPDDGSHFSITFETLPHQAWLVEGLISCAVDGTSFSSREIRAMTTGLFLSMLPLHADRPDRQRAFIANALRLYASLDAESGSVA